MNRWATAGVARAAARRHHRIYSAAGQGHVAGVIQNPAAVRAGHDFLLALAGHQNLRGQFHVAAAANAVLHAHDNVFALALEQPFITLAHGWIHRGRQLGPAALQFGKFLLQILLALVELRDLASASFFISSASRKRRTASFCAASVCSIKAISWSSIFVMSALHVSIS